MTVGGISVSDWVMLWILCCRWIMSLGMELLI